MKNMGIEIKFNTEITDITKLAADEIVVATGSSTRKLRMKGAERCIDAIDYLSGKEVGETVAIVGGGLTGCEIAYDLILKGKKPIIIETKNDLMAVSGLCLANSSYLRDYFKYKNIPVYLESKLVGITPKKIEIETKDGKRHSVSADSIITAIGYNPNPIAKASKNVHIVGDALRVGNLRTVIWRAWDVACKL